MPLLRNAMELRGVSPENPAYSLSDPALWDMLNGGAGPTLSGATVNEASALKSTAVFACVRVLAESIASLPLHVYERLEEGKRRATEHPVYRLLHDQPNPNMTAVAYREAMVGHVALWGNHYSVVEMDGAARVKALWPLLPDRTSVVIDGRRKYVVSLIDGQRVAFAADEVLHVPGLGFDGLTGYSVIQMGRQAVGLALATEEFGARWFGNGSRVSGVLQHPGRMSPEAHDRLKASWDKIHTGLSNSHKAAILEEGMTWQQIGVPPDDAQFLETRKFQTAEIARLFRVPPHLIGDLDRATFSNIEHQSIEFVVHTLRPWLVRLEQAMNLAVFGSRERSRYFCEHLVDGLLRGDMASRSTALQVWRQNGIINADEWREIENMNPLPDGEGKTYWRPANMADANAEPEPPAPPPPAEPEPEEEEQDIVPTPARAFAPLLEEAALRCVRREAQAVGAKARTMAGREVEFRGWCAEWYHEHREYVARQFAPVLDAMTAVLGVPDADERARPALDTLAGGSWTSAPPTVAAAADAAAYMEQTLPAETAERILAALTTPQRAAA